jgi:Predicted membrane protein (DUF2207)
VIREDIMSALKKKGMYLLDPQSANGYSVGAAIAILAPLAILQYLGWANFFNSALLLLVCLPVSAMIWWLFARVMTAKTVKGGQVRVAVLGFQEFMNRVDGERLKIMPPTTFEKFLPYAMALGVEHHWAQAFAGIVKDPPQWYVGPGGYGGGFNPIFFSSSMHSMATDITRSSCLRHVRVRAVRVLAEVAAAEAGSLVEASGAGAEARFEFPIMASTRGLNSWERVLHSDY